jgi:hypothetical protein
MSNRTLRRMADTPVVGRLLRQNTIDIRQVPARRLLRR